MSSLNRALNLLVVAALGVLLSLALSHGALAGTLFQSSPPPVNVQPTPTQGLPRPSTPAPAAPTAPPLVIEPTPTPNGFLPAPTLTSPGLVVPIQPVAPEALQPLPPYSEPTPSSPPPSTLDRLAGAAIETLGYVWLCCGGVMLAAAAVVFVWLTHRAHPPG